MDLHSVEVAPCLRFLTSAPYQGGGRNPRGRAGHSALFRRSGSGPALYVDWPPASRVRAPAVCSTPALHDFGTKSIAPLEGKLRVSGAAFSAAFLAPRCLFLQNLDLNDCLAGLSKVQNVRDVGRDVDDAAGDKRPAPDDDDYRGASILEIGDFHTGADRKSSMRGNETARTGVATADGREGDQRAENKSLHLNHQTETMRIEAEGLSFRQTGRIC
jgi:hypothetical protein